MYKYKILEDVRKIIEMIMKFKSGASILSEFEKGDKMFTDQREIKLLASLELNYV